MWFSLPPSWFSFYPKFVSLSLAQRDTTCAKPTANLSDPSKPIVIQASSPSLRILLKTTTGTGYSWYACGRYQAKLITPLKHHVEQTKSTLPGKMAVDVWTFKVEPAAFKVPRILRICLQYARAWDLKDSTVVHYTIVTQPNP